MRVRTIFLVVLALVLFGTLGINRYEAQQTNSGSPSGRFPADSGASWSAYGTKTDTSNLQLQAAPGALQSVYIYMAYCVNTSASTQTIALIKYSTTTVLPINCGPAGLYAKPVYLDPPLKIPANTAVTMNSVASASTVYLYAAGKIAR